MEIRSLTLEEIQILAEAIARALASFLAQRGDVISPANDPHFTETQLAERWQVSEKKLQKDRLVGGGCPYVALSDRAIRYRLSDIVRFENERVRLSTSDSRNTIR